jgi:hypothetical protein
MDENVDEKTTTVNQAEKTYTKEQILKSKAYRHKKDLINALLVDGNLYSLNTVDKIIKDFMEGDVK